MNAEYFAPCFEDMETRDLQNWLRHAQIHLDTATGSGRELTKFAISAAALELLFRYRQNA